MNLIKIYLMLLWVIFNKNLEFWGFEQQGDLYFEIDINFIYIINRSALLYYKMVLYVSIQQLVPI